MLDITRFAVNTCKHQLYIPNADKICKTPRCTLVPRPVLKLTRSPIFIFYDKITSSSSVKDGTFVQSHQDLACFHYTVGADNWNTIHKSYVEKVNKLDTWVVMVSLPTYCSVLYSSVRKAPLNLSSDTGCNCGFRLFFSDKETLAFLVGGMFSFSIPNKEDSRGYS